MPSLLVNIGMTIEQQQSQSLALTRLSHSEQPDTNDRQTDESPFKW